MVRGCSGARVLKLRIRWFELEDYKKKKTTTTTTKQKQKPATTRKQNEYRYVVERWLLASLLPCLLAERIWG